MSDSERDDEFEEYLKRRVPIDKGQGPLEPPPELDRIVIGKARKAIQGASPMHLYRAPKWALPVGLAATILLSFAILLDLGVRAKRNDALLQAASSQTSGMAASQSPLAALEPRSPAPVVAPASARPKANTSEIEQELSSDRARTRFAKAEMAARRARPEQDMADRALQGGAAVGSSATQFAPAAAAPMAPSPPPPADAVQSVSPPDALATPALATAAPAASGTQGATKVDNPDPARWLAQIEKLRSAGHTAEAEREMKRFRVTYPDYPLPKVNSH